MMPFLYFPENKLEYIPAFISLLFFMIVAYLVFRWIKSYSKKEEAKMKAFENEVMRHLKNEESRNGRSL